jgi:hypothetical protein
LDRRYYELVLDEHPRLTARPGRDVDDTITEPVKDFPFKVSDSDPEYFEFDIAPGPACLCSWKIALDWTSRGRSKSCHGYQGDSSVLWRGSVRVRRPVPFLHCAVREVRPRGPVSFL